MSDRESPRSEQEKAHDILAAEAFAMPAPDPTLRHRPIELPDDPSGIAEPHDVLAAEEFALPAPRQPVSPEGVSAAARARKPARIAFLIGVAIAALRALRRRRRV